MNVIRILLILGLVYVAMTQKSDKTRNMILIVTGLLAFCMFAKEGLQVSYEAGEIATASPSSVASCANGTVTTGCQLNTAKTGCEKPDDSSGFVAAGESECIYTPAVEANTNPRAALPSDLGGLFSSCVRGSRVKSTLPGTVAEQLCEPAANSGTGGWPHCGDAATSECSGMPEAVGGVALTATNQCNENMLGYKSTCICKDDTKTWPDCA